MGTNTGIGIGIGIPFKNNALGGDRPYLPPELKARLIGVWDNYGKKNTDADRNIIKNKIPNAGGDLEILNAAYKLNSGFGEYKEDFTSWRIYPNIEVTDNVITTNGNFNSTWFIYKHANENEINEMNIKVSGIPEGGIIRYFYIPDETATIPVSYNISEDGVYHLPKSKLSSNRVSVGFTVSSSYDWNNIRIEQLSDFGGAFVTDGINDIIISQKTLQEMGVTKDFTIVSMIHQISWRGSGSVPLTNYIRPIDNIYVRNQVADIGKTGIYGYVMYDVNNTSVSNSHVINTVLGDKNDYSVYTVGNLSQGKFSVQGYIDDNDNIRETSSVAHYWTFALLGKATEDDINLIIAYFNLDRTLKPDILCNTIKQGITNENHAEFGDKLIDFSGNGRDIQLNNIAWKGNSGIGRYETELSNTSIWTQSKETTSSPFSSSYNGLSGWIVFANTELTNSADMPSFKIQVKGLLEGQELIYRYYDSTGQSNVYSMDKDGEYTLPSDVRTAKPQISNTSGFQVVKNEANIITITQIPSHAGGLYLDGVNDFGKVTGMPVYKDYTVVADYERLKVNIGVDSDSPTLSKSESTTLGAFIFNTISIDGDKVSYSFGRRNIINADDTIRKIFYQSKYINDGQDINIESTFVDSDKLWLGTYRDSDYRFIEAAIYSLMSFPYSMSEFLIERQLKRYKLGTLYPDMVEFRPIIKANDNYKIFYTAMLPLTGDIWERINIGDYIPVGRRVAIQLSFDNEASELVSAISSQLGNISITKNSNNKGYTIFGDILKNKSPQKINITIDEYIRYEDIVQPYPVLLRFNDENGNEVSWGGKFRVGSTITRIGFAADSNLLPNIYNILGLLLNDNRVTSPKVIVEKTMVFKAKSAYIFDNNEPKCILSPRLLRIPNSSYKILGYIPDISGHGNHGKINNSAYAGMSGANGYPYDYKNGFMAYSNCRLVDSEIFNVISISPTVNIIKNTPTYKGKIKVTGLSGYLKLRIYPKDDSTNAIEILEDGVYDINIDNETGSVYFHVAKTKEGSNDISVIIQQVGEYEGAYCLDGVDDFITIPTTVGGKQVLMKVNSRKSDCYLYDQRNNWTQYLGIVSTKDFIAYNYSNQRGKTYIDGILNENITANDLIGITHNITVTNNRDDVKQYSPCIGTSFARNSYAQMALYDFMLFDGISTDDKIKELNEYVGIEGNTE